MRKGNLAGMLTRMQGREPRATYARISRSKAWKVIMPCSRENATPCEVRSVLAELSFPLLLL